MVPNQLTDTPSTGVDKVVSLRELVWSRIIISFRSTMIGLKITQSGWNWKVQSNAPENGSVRNKYETILKFSHSGFWQID